MNPKSRVLKRIPLERLMDLKVDYAFKQLFGSERNKDITVVFLNAVLGRTGRERIKDISFSNTEAGGEYEQDKQSRLDLVVVTDAGDWINVEIQFSNQFDMINRSIYYWAGLFREPMKRRMSYRELRPVIAINLLNFSIFNQTEKYHTTYHLYEDEEQFKLTDIMEFHFIEMSKLITAWKEEKLNPWDDILARWLLLLGIVDQRNGKVYDDIFKELEEIAMQDETLHSAFQSWETLSGTPEEMIAYQARLKRVMDEEAAIREAELRKQETELIRKESEQRSREAELLRQESEQRIREAELLIQESEQRIRKADQRIREAEHNIDEAKVKVLEEEFKIKERTARNLLSMGIEVDKVAEATELEVVTVLDIQRRMK